MMKRILSLALLTMVISAAEAADCEPQPLSQTALGLVKPLMELRIKESADQFTNDGDWRGESRYSEQVEKGLYSLLENRTTAGDEAVAFFLTVYMGEHLGEELVCEVMNGGKRMLPIVRAYQRCAPATGLEPFPKFVRGSGVLPGFAIEGIVKGETCGH